MPTAAKLISALLYALIGFGVASAYKEVLPDFLEARYFEPSVAVIGLFIGWWVMGPRVGVRLSVAMARGMSTSFYLAFWAIGVFALRDMLVKSTRLTYKTPTQAVLAVFENFVEFSKAGFIPPVLLILVIGGALAGILAELGSRRWS